MKHRSDANAATAVGSGPDTPSANGITAVAVKGQEEDDSGRPRKRARTDDTDDEIVEGMSHHSSPGSNASFIHFTSISHSPLYLLMYRR